jgi:hypothetical protein
MTSGAQTQDDFWRGRFTVWLYLVAKPFHVGD